LEVRSTHHPCSSAARTISLSSFLTEATPATLAQADDAPAQPASTGGATPKVRCRPLELLDGRAHGSTGIEKSPPREWGPVETLGFGPGRLFVKELDRDGAWR
jgi:hypothetical protein